MKKIVIIEDDPIIAHIYRTRLENEAYAVETCSDGLSGLDRVQEINPDAILLDLMLPKMNGLEFLKKIRAQSKFASTPIVVFTNAYLPNMIQDAAAAGATHVFNKAALVPKHLLDCLHFLIHGTNRSGDTAAGCSPSGGTSVALKGPSTESFRSLPNHPGSPPPPANYGYNNNYKGTTPHARRGTPSLSKPDDSFLDSELYKAFVAAKAETMAELRTPLHAFIKAAEADRERHLLDLYRKVHALTARAGLVKFVDVAQITSALEVLLKELHEQPKQINLSTLRTVAQSVDFIGELLNVSEPRCGELPPPNILVVDDEILSRRALVYALERGHLKSVGVEDPMAALKLVSLEVYDLILLDIQMPGLDGFELCTKIRALPTNQDTPVLFVTSLTDFKSRAKSTMSGGTDLIAKPFFFIEVTIKAITLILRKRLFPKAHAARNPAIR